MKVKSVCNWLLTLTVAWLAALFTGNPLQAEVPIHRDAAPHWVDWHEVDLSPEGLEALSYDNVVYIRDDHQIHLEEETSFRHAVLKLLNTAGVEFGSRLFFFIDPDYQSFHLHRLRIHRSGQTIDLLSSQELKARERERSLEWNLYDGQWHIEALLEDIRVGDVVEWAYSVKGFNPVYAGRFSQQRSLYLFYPVHRYRFRVLNPEYGRRPLRARLTGPAPDAASTEIVEENALWELKLSLAEETQARFDGPIWHREYPDMEFTEYASWASVVEWALPLYPLDQDFPSALREELKAIQELPSVEERVTAALRFVQDDIRYISIHSGLHSHAPHPLPTVARNRFGDCKDQAMLLCVLLRELGVAAWPVLVNTMERQAIANRWPSPDAFDHVIVMATLGGHDYLLDPTMSHQRGPLHTSFFPDYGRGLILRAGEDRLAELAGRGHRESRIQMYEYFQLPEEPDEPVRLTVQSLYLGGEADHMRSFLTSRSLRALERDYRDFYANEHREVELVSPLRVDDDEAQNRLTVFEEWLLPNPWHPGPEGGFAFLSLNPSYVRDALALPGSLSPPRPIGLAHPRNLEQIIQVQYPMEVGFFPNKLKIEHPTFLFEHEQSFSEDWLLTMTFSYESRKDHVAPEELASYGERVRDARDWTFHELYHPWSLDELAAQFVPHGPMIAFLVLMMAVGLLVGGTLGKWPARPDPDREKLLSKYPGLNGVGGWMLLPCVGLSLGFLRILYELFSEVFWLLDREVIEQFALTEKTYPGLSMELLILVEIGFLGFVLGVVPLLLVQIMRKRAAIRYAMPSFFLLAAVMASFSFAAMASGNPHFEKEDILSAGGEMVGAWIGFFIWAPYFLLSKRSRITLCQ